MGSTEKHIELVMRVQSGDHSAFEQWYRSNSGLVHFAHPFKNMLVASPDEQQEVSIDVLRAMRDYDPSSEGSPLPIILTYVRNGAMNRLNHSTRGIRRPSGQIIPFGQSEDDFPSLEDIIAPGDVTEGFRRDSMYDMQPDTVYEAMERKRYLNQLCESIPLSEKEKRVLQFFLQEISTDVVMETMGITRTNAGSILENIKTKLAAAHRKEVLISVGYKTGFFESNTDLPAWAQRGYRTQAARRIIQIEGIEPARLSKGLLIERGLLKRKDTTPKSKILYNLFGNEVHPWEIIQDKKWEGRKGKRLAVEGMKYLFERECYVINAELIEKYPWLSTMKNQVFNGRYSLANEYFQTVALGLSKEESFLIRMLAQITGNDSTILQSPNKDAAQKAKDHIDCMKAIVKGATLSKLETTIFEHLQGGLSIEEIAALFSSSQQERSKYGVYTRWNVIRKRFLASAIVLHKDRFEANAPLEQIERESQAMVFGNAPFEIYDRYFRLRLQTLIRLYAEKEKWDMSDLPRLLKRKTMGPLQPISVVFRESPKEMIAFALPGVYPNWMFASMNKWNGNHGKETAYQTINDILTKEHRFSLSKEMLLRYHLTSISKVIGVEGIEQLNGFYSLEKAKRLNLKEEEAENYRLNRKLLSLLYESNLQHQESRPMLSDEKIASLDRSKLYEHSGFSEQMKKVWEFRLREWSYSAKRLPIQSIATHFHQGKHRVITEFNATYPLLAHVISRTYASKENV